MPDIKPIRTEDDYDAALLEVERLWGAKLGTPEGDRLDVGSVAVNRGDGLPADLSCGHFDLLPR